MGMGSWRSCCWRSDWHCACGPSFGILRLAPGYAYAPGYSYGYAPAYYRYAPAYSYAYSSGYYPPAYSYGYAPRYYRYW